MELDTALINNVEYPDGKLTVSSLTVTQELINDKGVVTVNGDTTITGFYGSMSQWDNGGQKLIITDNFNGNVTVKCGTNGPFQSDFLGSDSSIITGNLTVGDSGYEGGAMAFLFGDSEIQGDITIAGRGPFDYEYLESYSVFTMFGTTREHIHDSHITLEDNGNLLLVDGVDNILGNDIHSSSAVGTSGQLFFPAVQNVFITTYDEYGIGTRLLSDRTIENIINDNQNDTVTFTGTLKGDSTSWIQLVGLYSSVESDHPQTYNAKSFIIGVSQNEFEGNTNVGIGSLVLKEGVTYGTNENVPQGDFYVSGTKLRKRMVTEVLEEDNPAIMDILEDTIIGSLSELSNLGNLIKNIPAVETILNVSPKGESGVQWHDGYTVEGSGQVIFMGNNTLNAGDILFEAGSYIQEDFINDEGYVSHTKDYLDANGEKVKTVGARIWFNTEGTNNLLTINANSIQFDQSNHIWYDQISRADNKDAKTITLNASEFTVDNQLFLTTAETGQQGVNFVGSSNLAIVEEFRKKYGESSIPPANNPSLIASEVAHALKTGDLRINDILKEYPEYKDTYDQVRPYINVVSENQIASYILPSLQGNSKMCTWVASLFFDVIESEIQVVDVDTAIESLFSKPLVRATLTGNDTSKTITIQAKDAAAYAQEEGLEGNTQIGSQLVDHWRETYDSTQIDDKSNMGDFLEALYNTRSQEDVNQTLNNVSRLWGLENVASMQGQIGKVGSQFCNMGMGGMGGSYGMAIRGQDLENEVTLENATGNYAGTNRYYPTPSNQWMAWGAGSYTAIRGDSYEGTGGYQYDGYKVSRAGFIGGLRRQFSDTLSGGILFAYTSAELNQTGDFTGVFRPGSIGGYSTNTEMDDFQFALHLERTFNEYWEGSLFVGGGAQSLDWHRKVYDPYSSESSNGGWYNFVGDTTGNSLTITAYLARRIQFNPWLTFRPTIGFDSEHSWIFGFGESTTDSGTRYKEMSCNQAYSYDKIQYSRNSLRLGVSASYNGVHSSVVD